MHHKWQVINFLQENEEKKHFKLGKRKNTKSIMQTQKLFKIYSHYRPGQKNFDRKWCPCHSTELHGTVPVVQRGGAGTSNSHGTLKA